MKNLSGLILVLGLTLALPAVAQAAEQAAQSQDGGAKPAKCLEAAVNPVTGYAVCVNPVGAPVDPPPVSSLQPCSPVRTIARHGQHTSIIPAAATDLFPL